MRIGYFADGPWSHQALELLLKDDSISVEFIVPRTDTFDSTLYNASKEHGIDYLHPVKINSEEFIANAKSYGCDLFVSMSFNQIFREPLISLPKYSTINCHAGKLPFYRGRNILNWAIINDEKEFGITVHFVDEGIDTGDIILQRTYPISDADDYSTLLNVAYTECATILYDAIKQIQTGHFKTLKQADIHPTGFYCGRRGEGDERINWNQNSRDVFNFIRALSRPGPRATTYVRGIAVYINRARIVSDAPSYKNTTGQIISKTKNGLLVKTADSFIELVEYESEARIKVGDRLD